VPGVQGPPAPRPASDVATIIDVTAAAYGCRGDGRTDDAPGLQRALDALAANSAAGGASVLYLPAGTYAVSRMLTLAGVRGGIIAGSGEWRSVVRAGPGVAGSPAVLRLTNCQHVTVRDLSVFGGYAGATVTAGVRAGAEGIEVDDADALSVGCMAILADRANTVFEVHRVAGRRGNTLSFVAPLERAYDAGDRVYVCPTACIQFFNDAGVPGRRFNASANRCERVSVGSDGLYACLDGLSIDCEGGTGSRSDADNENHVFQGCSVMNAARSAARIGHSNALNIHFIECALQGAVGLQMVTGGSFVMIGGGISATSWDFDLGGPVHHQCMVFGTYTESSSGFIRAAEGAGLAHCSLRVFGYDKKGAPQQGWLIDWTGTNSTLSIQASNLAYGQPPTLKMRFVERNEVYTVAPGSWVTFDDCDIGAVGFTLDRFGLIDDKSRWTAAPDGQMHEELLHSAQVMSYGSYNAFGATATQYKLGQLRGIRGISGPGARLAHNLCGRATLSGNDASTVVSFADPEPDADYVCVVSPSGETGSPAHGSNRVLPIRKSTHGFTLRVEAPPGPGNAVTFDWILMRYR
jgi:hypothetical protein